MGQRLNIEIVDNMNDKNILANCYYHWSGYTSSALYLADKVFDIKDALVEKYGLTKKAAIKILEETDATLTEEELKIADKMYPGEFSLDGIEVDRNNGLISISEEGIEETRKWEEARVTLYLQDDKINFNAICFVNEEDVEEKDKIPKFDFSPAEITYDQFKDFMSNVLNAIDNGIYCCKMNENYYDFIE